MKLITLTKYSFYKCFDISRKNESLVRSKSAIKSIIPSKSPNLNPVSPDENKTNSTVYISAGTHVKSYEE